jgi:hypothetical protein
VLCHRCRTATPLGSAAIVRGAPVLCHRCRTAMPLGSAASLQKLPCSEGARKLALLPLFGELPCSATTVAPQRHWALLPLCSAGARKLALMPLFGELSCSAANVCLASETGNSCALLSLSALQRRRAKACFNNCYSRSRQGVLGSTAWPR